MIEKQTRTGARKPELITGSKMPEKKNKGGKKKMSNEMT